MSLTWRMFQLTRGFRPRLAGAAVLGLGASAAGIGRLAGSGYALALVFQGQPFARLLWPLLGVLGCIGLRAVLEYAKEAIGNRTAGEIKVRVRQQFYQHVLTLGPGHFDQERTGDVVLAMVEGVEQLETFLGQYFPQLAVATLMPLLVFVCMAWFDLRTALVFVAFALFTLLVPFFFTKWTASSSLQRREAYSALGADFLDAVQGLATLKAFGQSTAHGTKLAERSHHVYRSTMGVLAVNIITSGMITLGIAAGAGVALGWGAIRVSHGELALPTLLVVLMLGVEIFRPLRELARLYHRGMIAMSAAKGIFALLDTEPMVQDTPQSLSFFMQQPTLTPEIRFEGVSFGYPKRPQVLQDVSLTLEPDQCLGLVGPSGAGKSTLIWLLLRFFDPQHGRILLGGQDIRTLPLAVLRSHIAVVMQDTYLIHGSVAENLRFGKPGASMAEIETAARAANAHDFIQALPQGYETVVGERGLRLSGGQRQRLAIARALLKDAPILLLDEALSSVDTENEALIQEALERLMAGRTTLIIAHRLSSVIDADRIVVIQDGAIVERGTHQELVQAGGTYARLMADQAALTTTGTRATGTSNVGHAEAAGLIDDSPQPESLRRSVVQPLVPSAIGGGELWWRLLLLVRDWWAQLSVTFFCGVGHVTAIIGIGVVSALIVGRVASGLEYRTTLMLLGLLIPLSALLHYLESWLAHDLAYRLLAEMRVHVYEVLDRLAPAYLYRRRSGDLVSLVTADVETVELFFAHTIAPGFVAIMVPGTVLAVLAYFAWPLALTLLPFLVLVALSPLLAGRQQERLGQELRAQLGEVNAYTVDSVQGLKEIVAFLRGPWQLAMLQAYGERLNRLRQRFLNHLSFTHVLVEALMGTGGLAVMTLGALLVTRGALEASTLPLLTLLALASFVPVSEIARIGKELADTLASARRIFAVQDEPVPVVDGPGVISFLPGRDMGVPLIQYEGVSFCYGPEEPLALRQVTFAVQRGQTVALVGRSGSGKTTAVHLLLRFWDPQLGCIRLGGRDLRDFQLDALRQQIALVSQDTYLFNTSIRDNLRLGRPQATDTELIAAAQQANAHEFILRLPDGYETRIGERGVQLSGGQRQRLAIARAILKDAPILLLDEATSHLDSENERLVHEALKRLMVGRTTLLIAHRLSTVCDAEHIVVLDQGVVAEQGTPEALLARGGVYAHLVAIQSQDSPVRARSATHG
ncbi:MAG TPA: ABC transporter ATP-binding protein [Candidatus Tectomicrobia bacterium]|jgi:ATP-binding cassette subfamily C protein CydCD